MSDKKKNISFIVRRSKEKYMVATNLIVLIIGFTIAGIGALAVKDKDKRIMTRNIGVIVAIAGVLLFVPFISDAVAKAGIPLDIDFGAGEGTGDGTLTQIVQSTPSGICAVEDTTVTLSATNKFTAAATGGTHRYRINNGPALTVTDAATLTASPGDRIQVLWGNAVDTTHFGAVTSEIVPCSGTKTYTTELVTNGSVTIEVFNEEGNLIVNGTENETMANGDVVTLTAKLKGSYQNGFPYGGVIVVEFNGTGSGSEFDDVIVDFGGSPTSVPSIYSITMGTSARTKAFTVPAILSNQIIEGTIVLQADSVINPSIGDLVPPPVLSFYPNDYFINDDTGGSFDGPTVTDEDDAQTGGSGHATRFYLAVD